MINEAVEKRLIKEVETDVRRMYPHFNGDATGLENFLQGCLARFPAPRNEVEEERRILYGNPSVPTPSGVIRMNLPDSTPPDGTVTMTPREIVLDDEPTSTEYDVKLDEPPRDRVTAVRKNVHEPGKPILYTGQRVGRNDPCPCQSGRKFKACHGKERNRHLTYTPHVVTNEEG